MPKRKRSAETTRSPRPAAVKKPGNLVRVGLIGLGAMGRVHFDCWKQSAVATLAAVSDRDPRKLAGEWDNKAFNLGDQAAAQVDLAGIATYQRAEDLIADPNIQAVDICMPTPMHAPLAIAALRAGKHVFCEKPMALNIAECVAMEETASEVGRQLMIGHCLRYWSHYVEAQARLASGEYGRAIYASFLRTGATPMWSSGGWLMRAKESGGVLDMHIHDIDVALWWFGRPEQIVASGYEEEGLPLIVDAIWRYADSLTAHLHAAWDHNGGAFRHAFKLVMEKATLVYDMAGNAGSLILIRDGKETALPMNIGTAYQAELDDFATCIGQDRELTRMTPSDSRAAVEVGLEELQQFVN